MITDQEIEDLRSRVTRGYYMVITRLRNLSEAWHWRDEAKNLYDDGSWRIEQKECAVGELCITVSEAEKALEEARNSTEDAREEAVHADRE